MSDFDQALHSLYILYTFCEPNNNINRELGYKLNFIKILNTLSKNINITK